MSGAVKKFIVVSMTAYFVFAQAVFAGGPLTGKAREDATKQLDALIARAQDELAQIDFTGATDPQKLAAGLRDEVSKVKDCNKEGLSKIKLAFIGIMENRLYLVLRDIRDGKAGTGDAAMLAREEAALGTAIHASGAAHSDY